MKTKTETTFLKLEPSQFIHYTAASQVLYTFSNFQYPTQYLRSKKKG